MQFYNSTETAKLLRIGRNKLQLLRELGAIDFIKTGRGYVYSQESIEKFYKTFKYCDMSNEQSIAMNVAIKKARPLARV